jgi:hypothetical protein
VLKELVAAVEALDALAAVDPAELADSESVLVLQRQRNRLEAIATRSVASWDARQAWADDDARTGPAWLAARTHMPLPSARRIVGLGRALRHLPVAEAAWLAGEIDSAHVRVLAMARTEHTAEAMARDEAELVHSARTMFFSHFKRVVDYWYQHADPDGVERNAKRQVDGRRLDISTTFQGAVVGDFVLDPINGTVVAETIANLERELFEADWAEAKARLGRDPLVAELRRTAKQRRADALLEMAVRSRTAPKDGRRPAPLFSVFVGFETFAGRICELANGTVVTPGALVPWLDETYVERVVFDGPSRVIDVGEQRRFFAGATRRGVEVRDRECFSDTCEERGDHLQVDHILPASQGGPTVMDNGRLACGFHNRRRHKRRPGAG